MEKTQEQLRIERTDGLTVEVPTDHRRTIVVAVRTGKVTFYNATDSGAWSVLFQLSLAETRRLAAELVNIEDTAEGR